MTIAKLHDGDRRQRLGDRSVVIDRLRGDAGTAFAIGQPILVMRDNVAVADEHDAGPDNAVTLGRPVEHRVNAVHFAGGPGGCA